MERIQSETNNSFQVSPFKAKERPGFVSLQCKKKNAKSQRVKESNLVLEAPHRQPERLDTRLAVDLRNAGTEEPGPRNAATAERRPEEPDRPANVERAPEGVAGEVSFKE